MLYADGAILISEDIKAVNRPIVAIVHDSHKYGLNLNKTKCELLCMDKFKNPGAETKFADQARVPDKTSAMYLGCILNLTATMQK